MISFLTTSCMPDFFFKWTKQGSWDGSVGKGGCHAAGWTQLGSDPRVEGEIRHLKVVLWCLHVCCGTCVHQFMCNITYNNKLIIIIIKLINLVIPSGEAQVSRSPKTSERRVSQGSQQEGMLKTHFLLTEKHLHYTELSRICPESKIYYSWNIRVEPREFHKLKTHQITDEQTKRLLISPDDREKVVQVPSGLLSEWLGRVVRSQRRAGY